MKVKKQDCKQSLHQSNKERATIGIYSSYRERALNVTQMAEGIKELRFRRLPVVTRWTYGASPADSVNLVGQYVIVPSLQLTTLGATRALGKWLMNELSNPLRSFVFKVDVLIIVGTPQRDTCLKLKVQGGDNVASKRYCSRLG